MTTTKKDRNSLAAFSFVFSFLFFFYCFFSFFPSPAHSAPPYSPPPLVSQSEAEAGISTATRSWNSLRIAQAIAAQAGAGATGVNDGAWNVNWNTDTTHSPSKNAAYGVINPLLTTVGVAAAATSLGTFTGTTIPDNQTVKAALQALETSLETKQAGLTAASQAEMEAGTESAIRSMSPLRVAQAIAALASASSGDVTAANSLTDTALIQGNGGTKGIKTSKITLDANSNIKIGDGSQASQTITGDVSGTDTVLTFGNGIINISTGTLQAGGYAVLTTNTSNISAANLASVLTFAATDSIDLSAITITVGQDYGLALPTYADVVPASEKFWVAYDAANNALMVRESGGWVNVGASAAAPTSARYVVTTSNGNLSNEGVLTAGVGMDITDNAGDAGTVVIDFDSTEIGATTWGSGTDFTWTFNPAGATNPTIAFANDSITLSVAHVTGAASVGGLLSANGGLTVATGQTTTLVGVSGILKATTGVVGGSATLDDLGEGTTYKRVVAANIDANLHVSRLYVPAGAGYVTVSGPTGAVILTVDNADQELAARNKANTFTLANTFNGDVTVGNAATDILTIQSMIRGTTGTEVQINSGARTTPTYPSAAPTGDLYVSGNVEIAGTVYANKFIWTGTGDSFIDLTSNAGTPATAGTNSIYVKANSWKVKENGSEKDLVTPDDSVTWTGATHSFAAVTNMVMPNQTVDAAGEIAINQTSHQLQMHLGGASADNAVNTFDFDSCANGQVFKTNGSGVWTCADDVTAGAPTLNTIGNPVADSTFTIAAGNEINFNYTGNFTTGSQFLIEQKTGNPSGGVVFEVKTADSDVVNSRLGDGTNYIQISQSGNLSHGGTSSLVAPKVTTSIAPISAGGATLGTTALEWGNVYLTDSAVIYGQADQSNSLTSSATGWTFNLPVTLGPQTTTAGSIYFQEGSGGGTNKVRLQGPASTADVTVTLPAAAGTLALNDQTMYIGTTAVAINRTTAALTLAGITLTTPDIGAATGTSLLATGRIDGTVGMVLSTAGSATTIDSTSNKASYYMNQGDSAAHSIFTLPTAAAGLQYCARNYTGITQVLKFQTSAAGQYIDLDGVNTATGGLIKSGGAAGDACCVVGVDSTHWVAYPSKGTWTKD